MLALGLSPLRSQSVTRLLIVITPIESPRFQRLPHVRAVLSDPGESGVLCSIRCCLRPNIRVGLSHISIISRSSIA